jgi:hypothetical protein
LAPLEKDSNPIKSGDNSTEKNGFPVDPVVACMAIAVIAIAFIIYYSI